MARMVLLTRGTGGDVFPFIRIGTDLKLRGHEVVLLSYSKFKDVAEKSGVEFRSFDPFMPYAEWLAEKGLKESTASQGAFFVLEFTAAYKTIEQHRGQGPTIFLGHSNIHTTVKMAAEKLGAHYVPMFMAPFFSKVMGATMKVYAAERQYLDEARAAVNLPPVSDWTDYLTARRRALGLWPDWFDRPDEMEAFDVKRVGFLRNEEVERGELPADLKAFLDCGEPPVFITHASSKPKDDQFFDVAVEACRLLGLRCVVVDTFHKAAARVQMEWVRYYSHLPFSSLMTHVQAMIHHGGIGTLGLCLAYGTPQVVLGLGFDRPDNGARLKRLGVADYLPAYQWRAQTIAESLRRVTSPQVREHCRSYSARVRGEDASRAVCEFLESLV